MSNRNRLASLRIPAPSVGWLPDQGARNAPPQGAVALQNIRIDSGLGRSRPGRAALVVNPPLDTGATQTGTASFDSTSTAVTGVGTLFLTEYAVGDYIKNDAHDDSAYTRIASISDNTNLVLTSAYRGATSAGVTHRKATAAGRAVVTLDNIAFPNETVESLLFERLKAHRFLNNAWVPIAGAANAWTGTDSDKFWALKAPFAGADRIICSNGIDTNLKVWAGSTTSMTNYAGSVGARFGLMGDDSRLIIADTIEAAVRYTQRVRWTVIGLANGDATDWSGTGSGLLELRNDGEPIRGMWKQFGRIFIGKRRAIIALLPTGIATAAYTPETVVEDGDGPFTGSSIVKYGNLVAFMTARGFGSFDGTNVSPLDNEKVRDTLRRRLNKGKLSNVTSFFDEDNNRIGWGLPLDGSEIPTEIWWFNIDTGAWEYDTITHTALGPFTNVDITTVDDLTGGTVDALSPTFVDDLSPPGSAVVSLVVGSSTGVTSVVDNDAPDDLGVGFTSLYATPVLPLIGTPIQIAGQGRAITPDDYLELDSIEIALLDRGDDYTLLVEISKDGGASWVPVGNASLTSTAIETARRIVETTVHKRLAIGGALMVRLSNVTASAKWGWADFTIWIDVVGRKR